MNEQQKCVVCENPLSFRWTDTHGIGACGTCGLPYTIYHYEGDGDAKKRVEKSPSPAIYDWAVAIGRRYWQENHRRVFPGSYDMGILGRRGATYSGATESDMQNWDDWCAEHKDEFPPPEAQAHTTERAEIEGTASAI